jgi:hypothetical protein
MRNHEVTFRLGEAVERIRSMKVRRARSSSIWNPGK